MRLPRIMRTKDRCTGQAHGGDSLDGAGIRQGDIDADALARELGLGVKEQQVSFSLSADPGPELNRVRANARDEDPVDDMREPDHTNCLRCFLQRAHPTRRRRLRGRLR